MKRFSIIIIGLLINSFFLASCEKDATPGVPTDQLSLTTTAVTLITQYTAEAGGMYLLTAEALSQQGVFAGA